MFKLPQSILFAIVAFNITAFTVLLQLDMLFFKALPIKLVAWLLTIGSWMLTWKRRKKYFVLF